MDNRLQRITDFAKFKNDAKNIFEAHAENDDSHKHLGDLFSLCICPGGRMGGVNEKVVEIFYGNRPIGRNTTIDQNLQKCIKLETEGGARLLYSLTYTGNVFCTLFPAKSENRSPIEDAILFDYIKSPSSLEKKSASHWKAFLSYMEVTYLDGNPTLIQRLKVFYLRNFKRYKLDNTIQVSKVSVLLKEVFKYVLTIGLSGFLILVFIFIKDNIEKKKDESQYQKMQLSLETITKTVSNISKRVEKSELILQELAKFEKLNRKSIEGVSKDLSESKQLLKSSVDELKKIEANILPQ